MAVRQQLWSSSSSSSNDKEQQRDGSSEDGGILHKDNGYCEDLKGKHLETIVEKRSRESPSLRGQRNQREPPFTAAITLCEVF